MKILIADDDPVSRRVLRQILGSVEPGCEIVEAANGSETLTVLQTPEHGLDVAFLDISMPECDGLEVFRTLQKDPSTRNLPVVLCTAANDRATVIKAASLGARHYIVKPAATSVVAARLKQIRAALAANPAPATPETKSAPTPDVASTPSPEPAAETNAPEAAAPVETPAAAAA